MENMLYIGAGLAVGLSGLGVAIGQGLMTKKSIKMMGINPDLSNTFLVLTVLGIALVESAVIYGLIIAFNILGSDPSTTANIYAPVAAGLATGMAGLGAGLGEGMLVSGAMDAVLKHPEQKGKIITYMVLFLALVESVAIYGLIIAFSVL